MANATAFTYRGRNTDGKIVKGRLDAPGEAAVASRLRTMGVSPIAIEKAPEGTGLNREINLSFGTGVKLKDLAVASRQMATMIGSGLSLLKTLNILAEQTENKKLADVLGGVRDDVETGMSIADSMRRSESVFTPLMVNMVRAGEAGGFLDRALDSVAANFEKEVKLRATIKPLLG